MKPLVMPVISFSDNFTGHSIWNTEPVSTISGDVVQELVTVAEVDTGQALFVVFDVRVEGLRFQYIDNLSLLFIGEVLRL